MYKWQPITHKLNVAQDSCSVDFMCGNELQNLGSVVQSIVSLTSLLVVKMLTVLVSNSQAFLLKKCEQLLQMQKLLTFFFQKKY